MALFIYPGLAMVIFQLFKTLVYRVFLAEKNIRSLLKREQFQIHYRDLVQSN